MRTPSWNRWSDSVALSPSDRRAIWLCMEVMDKLYKERDLELSDEAKVVRDRLEKLLAELNKRQRGEG